ncbi:MAG TPA: hypothetical protein VK773_00110, partial [Acidimicrobiales bacterium]|nr:hypothetical protein [Acidimicrobiales bacterium]
DRTTVTELGTGLGMLGRPDIDQAIAARPAVMHSLSPEMWQHLALLRGGGAYDAEFHAAWENGRAFLAAGDGLRGRMPQIVEWKGTGRAPGDEVAPIDLRVDHVYLVSCKYLSDILFNVSPASVFDSLLIAGQSRSGRGAAASAGREVQPGGGDWYAEVAPAEYQALYAEVRDAAGRGEGVVPAQRAGVRRATAMAVAPSGRGGGPPALPGLGALESGANPDAGVAGTGGGRTNGSGALLHELRELPHSATDLTSAQRDALGKWLRPGWPPGVKDLYVRLSDAVARASVRRWEAAMDRSGGTGEAMLWRLLRIGSAPYFVLGSSAERSLRLRIATSWDWRQQFQLSSMTLEPQRGGQPRVGWQAVVRDRTSAAMSEIAGHIEVRWSHGRFGGLPEAKGYLDTAHHLVPGYFALR